MKKSKRVIFLILLLVNSTFATDLTIAISTDTASSTGGIFNPSGLTGDLRGALNYFNLQAPGAIYAITFSFSSTTISPVAPLSPINLDPDSVKTLTIVGNSNTLSGGSIAAGNRGGFFVANCNSDYPWGGSECISYRRSWRGWTSVRWRWNGSWRWNFC